MESNRIKFGLFLSLQVLALFAFLGSFLLYSRRRDLRRSVSYDVIFVLLFVTFALSLSEVYMFTSHVYPSSEAFCLFWNWFHYALNIINLFLMAFASIQRHFLIFRANIFRSQRGKVLFHYLPILFCLVYPPMFYMGAIFLCPCENAYDYTRLLCTWPCYFENKTWANIDLFLNNCAPLFTIPIFCSTIYVRVWFQRRAMRLRAIKWRRDKKLIFQLLAISSLYLAAWMPLQIAGLVDLFWDPFFLLQAQIDYMYLFPYLIHVIYPIIVLLIIVHKRRARSRAVQPMGRFGQ
jgi:hypothetical protein